MAETTGKPSSVARATRPPKLYYRRVIVIVAGLLQFAGGTETFPVLGLFLKPMREQFGWSKSMFTLPMTVGTMRGGFSAVLVGPALGLTNSPHSFIGTYSGDANYNVSTSACVPFTAT